MVFDPVGIQLVGLSKTQRHLSRNLQSLHLNDWQLPGGRYRLDVCSLEAQLGFLVGSVDGERLEVFQLLVEGLVAEQEPLGQLDYSIETINKVLYFVEDVLVILYLGLSPDDLSVGERLYSGGDRLKFQVDIFFDDFSLVFDF